MAKTQAKQGVIVAAERVRSALRTRSPLSVKRILPRHRLPFMEIAPRGVVLLPMGADRPLPLGCRLVKGFEEHPDDLVARDRLLQDMRYRVGHRIVRLPPLQERQEEIASYAQRFLEQTPTLTGVGGGPTTFAPEAMQALEAAT